MKHPLVFPVLFVLLSFSIIYLLTGDHNMVYGGVLVVAGIALLWNLFSVNQDRKRIREKEKLYLAVIEHGQDALIVTDLMGSIKMANHQSEKLLGFVKNGLLNRNIREVIPAETQDSKNNRIEISELLPKLAKGSDIKLDAVKQNGDTIPVSINVTQSYQSYIIIINDFSWQRNSYRYYDQYHIKHQMLKNLDDVMIWQYNTKTGSINWETHNKNFFDLDFSQAHLNEFAHFIHPDDKSDFLKLIQETAETGLDFDLEHRIVQTDGSVVWLRNQAILIGDRETPLVAGLAINITEQKNQEDQWNQCCEILEQNKRERYYFVGRISDHLFTMVQPLHKCLTSLKQIKDLDPSVAPKVKIAHQHSTMIQEFITEIAELSRIETEYSAAKLEPVTVSKVMLEVLQETDRKIRSNKFILDNQLKSNSVINCDPVMLKSIFSHIIDSLITLNGKNGKLRVSDEQDSKSYMIRFIDTNDQVDTSDLENMLDAFGYLDPIKKISMSQIGLKLAMAKSAVEKMHGILTVESNPNFGNTISLQWPQNPWLDTDNFSKAPEIKILYLEDSANNIRIMETAVHEFTEANLQVMENYNQGLSGIKDQPYDIIFVNLDSPMFADIDILGMIPNQDSQYQPQLIGISQFTMDQYSVSPVDHFAEIWQKPLDPDLVRLKILEIKQQRKS